MLTHPAAQGGTPTLRTIGISTQPPVAPRSFTGTSGATGMNAYYMSGVTGALPSWAGLSATPGAPKIMVRAAQ